VTENVDKRTNADGKGVERVHEQVRDAILHGELPPGSYMSQVQLARKLGSGRGPLREALRMLQREGLIEAEANRRVRVAEFSVEDLEQLYAMRITNEALGIRLTIPQMDAGDDRFLDESLRQMDRHANAREIEIWEKHHRAFHQRLVSHAGQRLRRTLAELSDHSERYRRLYIEAEPRAWSMAASEHESIVEACRLRDPAEAASRLARHLARTALTVLMIVVPEHEPATVRAALGGVVGSDRVASLDMSAQSRT
jgi:DNA-binding GntR family transcriptional regulator